MFGYIEKMIMKQKKKIQKCSRECSRRNKLGLLDMHLNLSRSTRSKEKEIYNLERKVDNFFETVKT